MDKTLNQWNTLNDVTTSEFEDVKTLKAIMFIMIQEHVKNIPNDQELGKRIRKIINNFEKDIKSSEFLDLMTTK